MTMFRDDQLEAALAELVRTDEIAGRILGQGAGTSHQTSDKSKILSVTVSGHGELRELRFRGDAYRELAPAELADLLVKTIEQARQTARQRALEGVQELMRELPPIGRLSEVGSTDDFVEELLGLFTRNMPDSGAPPAPPDQNGRWS
jgi:DNA-binding protein YbaB